MRKLVLGILALVMTLTAMAGAPKPAHGQPICPLCIIGFHCCIHGNVAKCVPESHPCN